MNRARILSELTTLVNANDWGSNNVAAYIANHAEELPNILGCAREKVSRWASEANEVVSAELADWLAGLASVARGKRRDRTRAQSREAAVIIGNTARWLGSHAFLDVGFLFRTLLADRRCRTVRFTAEGVFDVSVRRETVARLARIQRRLSGVTAWVDNKGLHIRWKGAQGGCDWRSQKVDTRPSLSILLVTVTPPPPERLQGTSGGCVLLDMALKVP
jgi:hypothetical protein